MRRKLLEGKNNKFEMKELCISTFLNRLEDALELISHTVVEVEVCKGLLAFAYAFLPS